jgi:DNA-directed RNA polymerase subunit E'
LFRAVTVEDIVRIPPERFGEELERIAYDQLREKYLGRVDPELGLVIAVWKVKVDPIGTIIPGDGATYHKTVADLLTYYPVMHEVVEGEIVDVKKIGIFVNVGPIDAFAHISQIADDRLTFDELRGILQGEETKVTFGRGDVVRGRIVNVSLAPPTHIRIGMTLKQPALGKIKEGGR